MAKRTLAVVMAGGMGERLRPLTDVRAKPAVPFGAIFRIIDFTLSNCINSDIRQILVLTQYKSHSLSRHLTTGFNFLPPRLDEFIEEIPAQMQLGNQWYKGTADAIRQNLSFINNIAADNLLILAGDHIYKMDYRLLRDFHQERGRLAHGLGHPCARPRWPPGSTACWRSTSRAASSGSRRSPRNPSACPAPRIAWPPWASTSSRTAHSTAGWTTTCWTSARMSSRPWCARANRSMPSISPPRTSIEDYVSVTQGDQRIKELRPMEDSRLLARCGHPRFPLAGQHRPGLREAALLAVRRDVAVLPLPDLLPARQVRARGRRPHRHGRAFHRRRGGHHLRRPGPGQRAQRRHHHPQPRPGGVLRALRRPGLTRTGCSRPPSGATARCATPSSTGT